MRFLSEPTLPSGAVLLLAATVWVACGGGQDTTGRGKFCKSLKYGNKKTSRAFEKPETLREVGCRVTTTLLFTSLTPSLCQRRCYSLQLWLAVRVDQKKCSYTWKLLNFPI